MLVVLIIYPSFLLQISSVDKNYDNWLTVYTEVLAVIKWMPFI